MMIIIIIIIIIIKIKIITIIILSSSHTFIPIATETMGPINEDGEVFLDQVNKRLFSWLMIHILFISSNVFLFSYTGLMRWLSGETVVPLWSQTVFVWSFNKSCIRTNTHLSNRRYEMQCTLTNNNNSNSMVNAEQVEANLQEQLNVHLHYRKLKL